MSGRPDPKPPRRRQRPRRIVDAPAVRAGALAHRVCAACGRDGSNGHHVLPRGNGGDDVPDNIVSLCGSGTAGCHGAYHGSPYTDAAGRRWTGEDVRRAIGVHLLACRPDAIAYVIGKLGGVRGAYFLERHYFIVRAS